MRKVVLGLGVSLDGYIARKNGAVDWLSMDWEYGEKGMNDFFNAIDVVLMGRKTLEHAINMFPPRKGKKPKNPYGKMKTYVFSKTWKTCDVEDVEVYSGDPKKLIKELKAKKGKNIWLSGGGELAKSFLDAGLVDEINLGVVPHLLGEGISLFPELAKEIPLRLVSCTVHKHTKEDNGMLDLMYEVKK